MEQDYKNLDVWKESRKLVNLVYLITGSFPPSEQFGLTAQIKRSCISVPSNIAEGIGRGGKNECKQFFKIAKGSLYELETQLYIAIDLKFLQEKEAEEIFNQIVSVRKLIIGFQKYLDNKA